ncbi:MAG: hypothetical protein Q4E07_03665, partial [Eubacteriales bacterium]|nr:hypothetical protein [Eubacteriales bacterium]
MNAFADWLFTVLLGWTGRVSNNLWSSFSKGGDGFASLLSKIWLPLLLIIIAVSTVIDLIIRLNKRGVYNMRRERLQRLEQEHNTMREAMEHGEMADEYREEIASFVENSPAPFVAEGFFDGQENAPMHHPQQSAPATDFFEPPQEQTFFASENYEYQEPEIYLQPEMQDIYRHEYFDQPTPNSNYIQETYSEQDNYVQEEYTEQDNYNQETYSESD